MKVNVIINPTFKEDIEVDIKAQKEDERIAKITSILNESNEKNLVGYEAEKFVILDLKKIYYFSTENGKVFAHLEKDKYLVKKRIFELLEYVKDKPNWFLINQGAIANLDNVLRMETYFNGSIVIVFNNNEKEYASRIQTSLLKKKLGL
jgi:DNA-binding LytR/AlgR family response regulator